MKFKLKGISQTELSKLNIVSSVLNQLVTIVCGIVIPRVIISVFGSEAYGISVSIAQFLSYVALLESGIGGVARAKLYGPLAEKDDARVSAVYFAIRRFFMLVGGVFAVYSIGLGAVYHDIAGVEIFSRTYVFFLVLTISISTLVKYTGGLADLTLINADRKQYVHNFINIIVTAANAVLVVILAKVGLGLIWVKLGSSLLFIVKPILYAIYVKKHYRLKRDPKRKVVLEQKWTGVGQHIAYFIHMNTDVVLLTLLADIKTVAVYSIYSLVISSIRGITESFAGGMEARFGELIATGRVENLRSSHGRYRRLLSAASFVLFSCAGILIVPFVRIYTAGVSDANYIQPAFAFVLLMAETFNCISFTYPQLAVAANRFKQTRWGAYGEALINIGVSLALISKMPLVGVAIGTLAATVFRGIFYAVYASRNILGIGTGSVLAHMAAVPVLMMAVIVPGARFVEGLEIGDLFHWFICAFCVFAAAASAAGAYLLIHRKLSGRRQVG